MDPLQLRYTHAFRNNNAPATPHNHLWLGSDLPLKLKENTYLLLSPFYEQWGIDSADKKNIVPGGPAGGRQVLSLRVAPE